MSRHRETPTLTGTCETPHESHATRRGNCCATHGNDGGAGGTLGAVSLKNGFCVWVVVGGLAVERASCTNILNAKEAFMQMHGRGKQRSLKMVARGGARSTVQAFESTEFDAAQVVRLQSMRVIGRVCWALLVFMLCRCLHFTLFFFDYLMVRDQAGLDALTLTYDILSFVSYGIFYGLKIFLLASWCWS